MLRLASKLAVQTATAVIAGISVIIGVINSIVSSRRAAQNGQLMLETRQAQLFAQLHEWWRSRDAMRAYGNVRFRYRDAAGAEWGEVVGNIDTFWKDFMKKYDVHVDLEA